VMQSGNGSSCMINDRILGQGDVVEGFTIGQISADCVELIWLDRGGAGTAESETEPIRIILKLSQ